MLATVELGSRNLWLEAREGFLILIWPCSMLSRNHYILLIEITMLIKGTKTQYFHNNLFRLNLRHSYACPRREAEGTPHSILVLLVVLKNQVESEEV